MLLSRDSRLVFCYIISIMRPLIVFFFVFFVVLGLLLRNQAVLAVDHKDGSLEIVPAYLEVSLEKANETKQIHIDLTNHSSHHVALEMFPIDFKQRDLDGLTTFIGQQEGSYSYSLASFLSFESNRVELDPGEKKPFVVQIKNRSDVSPGGHYAAIIARLINESMSSGSTYVAPSVSSLIYLSKTGGDKYKISLNDVSWPINSVVFSYPVYMQLTMQNEGNVHLVPYGLMEIKDNFNRRLFKGIINNNSARILPESRRNIDVDISRLTWSWPVSFNTMTITGHDSLNKVTYSRTKKFLYIHPLFVMLLLVGVGLCFRLLVLRKKK